MRFFLQSRLKHLFGLIVLATLLAGCASKEQHPPPLTYSQALFQKCDGVFPEGTWQFVHSIDFAGGGANTTTVIGVTTLAENSIHSALLTVEGLTLFAADFLPDDSLNIQRAVPPFDNPHFAKGMMRDIRTIFAPPDGVPRKGRTAAGNPVCRYTDDQDMVTDILPKRHDDNDDCWRIRRYTPEGSMDLAITGTSCKIHTNLFIPQHLELQSFGMTEYTLKMKLISADRLQ